MLVYRREQDGERFLVALNFGPDRASVAMDGQGTIAASVLGARAGQKVGGRLALAGNDGLLIKLD